MSAPLVHSTDVNNKKIKPEGFYLGMEKGFCPNIPNRKSCASMKPTQALLARSALPNTFASLLATHLETQNPRHFRRGFLLRRKKGFEPSGAWTPTVTRLLFAISHSAIPPWENI